MIGKTFDYVVLGLGLSGYTMAEFLVKQGFSVAVTDSRWQPPYLTILQDCYPHITVSMGRFDQQLIDKAHCVAVSPGIDLRPLGLTPNPQTVIGEIELFAHYRTAHCPVVAITGTNGKTTVTTLVGQMLKAEGYKVGIGGNIGTPALALLQDAVDYYVLELSSFQLETTFSLKPKVAVILNIMADHLDRYASIEAYQQAKQRIYHQAQYCIYAQNDSRTFPFRKLSTARLVSFGTREPQSSDEYGLLRYNQQTYLAHNKTPLVAEQALQRRGGHHTLNALAACAIVGCLQVVSTRGYEVLGDFKGLSHRCEIVGDYHGVTWINDSKATNLAALLRDVLTVDEQLDVQVSIRLLVGGQLKDKDLSEFTKQLPQSVTEVFTFGESCDEWRAVCPEGVACYSFNSLKQAVRAAIQKVYEVDLVMLVPGGASFDEFDDYIQRGDYFKRWVVNAEVVDA